MSQQGKRKTKGLLDF